MQFEVLATDGQKVSVDAVDWMMAMATAMPILGIEVSGWMCNPRADGSVDVMDPMSGASWRVRKVGVEAPAKPVKPGAGPPPPPASLVGASVPASPAFGGRTVSPAAAVAPPPPAPAAPEAPAPPEEPAAPAPVARTPSGRPVPRPAPKPVAPIAPPAPPEGRKPPTTSPGAITGMWSRAQMSFDDEDDDSDEVDLPEASAPDDLAERLFDVSTDLYQAENATAACRMALDILLQLVPSEAGSVLRGKREEGMLTFVATAGPAAKKLLGQKMHFGQGVVGASFDLGITILVHDVRKDTRHLAKFDQQTGFETRSVLSVPLRHQYNVFGVIELINPVEGRFQAWHVEAMETVARTVGQLLAGSR